ncbi:MAG TPA: DUF2797 domain-containing protein [Desulfobacterales bacterium]|nr:DUF2797 domain-containing protein [Desulfobacterales bacterium]
MFLDSALLIDTRWSHGVLLVLCGVGRRELHIEFLGEINCVKRGRKTNKSSAQGFCYPCFASTR